jgi:hypothetical protein
MALFWKKKEAKKQSPQEKSEESIRIDAEDMIDQNFSCAEIASELGIEQERVYRIKEAKKRRDARMNLKGDQQESGDPIKEMNVEIKKLELEQKKQELQWALEDRQRERQDDLREAMNPGTEEGSSDPGNNFMNVAGMALLSRLLPGQQQPQNPPSYTTVPQAQASTPASEQAPHAEPVGTLSEEQVQQYASMIKTSIPKKYLPMIDQLKTLQDVDLIRIKNEMVK